MIIINKKSPNFSKKTRNLKDIKFIIFHYTGMQSTRESLERLTNKKFKVSCHYLISREGIIYKMIDNRKIAWHAGKSKWKNFKNLNDKSIGIELQNKGHEIYYEKFTKIQIISLLKLLKKLMKKYKIKKHHVLGHSDIAPLRKTDPGEKFPWRLLSKNGVSIWYIKSKLKIKSLNDERKRRKLFFKNLLSIGYRYFRLDKKSVNDKCVVKAFQMRFLPESVNGKITNKTLQISQLLVKKPNFT